MCDALIFEGHFCTIFFLTVSMDSNSNSAHGQ